LARLVNRSHAALANETDNLKLRKELGDFLNRGRHKARGRLSAGCLSGKAGLE
jgi:hypothetical protein